MQSALHYSLAHITQNAADISRGSPCPYGRRVIGSFCDGSIEPLNKLKVRYLVVRTVFAAQVNYLRKTLLHFGPSAAIDLGPVKSLLTSLTHKYGSLGYPHDN